MEARRAAFRKWKSVARVAKIKRNGGDVGFLLGADNSEEEEEDET